MFVATWGQTTQITVWFLYIGLAFFTTSLLTKLNPAAWFLEIPVQLAAVVISIWCNIRLMLALLNLVDGHKAGDLKTDSRRAWLMFVPLTIVGLCQGLAILGGFVLLIIPGIYLSVSLVYAQLIFVDQGLRSWQALSASRELVRDRWWAVFWRNLVASLVIGVAMILIVFLILSVFVLVAGSNRFIVLSGTQKQDPLVNGATALLSSILQAAFLPLILGFQVRLYRLLQKTR